MEVQKFTNQLRKRVRAMTSRQWMGLVLGLAGIALAFLFAFLFWRSYTRVSSSVVNSTVPAVLNERDPLTGVRVEHAQTNKQIYGVMIDEHVDARPQSGIDQAFLVIEAPVEAGIPRLLAFFSEDQKVDEIGPVRSARPYFIDWANEFDALYTHVGGSNEALDKISTGITFDLNQFWHDPQFWRSSDRNAPHNVYTSTDLLGAYVKSKTDAGHASNPLYGVWKFKDPDLSVDGVEQDFSIAYAGADYTTSWSFDSVAKNYILDPVDYRVDANVRAENVAVVVTDVAIIDAVGRRSVRTIGEGKAFVFQDGKKIEAVWKKPSATERLRFFDGTRNEIEMNAGVTWIEIVGNKSQLQEVPLEKIQEGRD